MEIGGAVVPGFEPVRDEFAALFGRGDETGAAFAAIAGGSVVADLWGGDVRRDSLVHVQSVTKQPAAAAALWLVDRGWIALDAHIVDVWPEHGRGRRAIGSMRGWCRRSTRR